MRKTLRQSEALLLQGKSIVICPDVNYSDTGATMGQTYAGFLALDKAYRASTGRPLAFVPVHCSAARHRVCFGAPVYCEENSRSGRQQAAQVLACRVNAMAAQCGDASSEVQELALE